jgi:hypothetical protein
MSNPHATSRLSAAAATIEVAFSLVLLLTVWRFVWTVGADASPPLLLLLALVATLTALPLALKFARMTVAAQFSFLVFLIVWLIAPRGGIGDVALAVLAGVAGGGVVANAVRSVRRRSAMKIETKPVLYQRMALQVAGIVVAAFFTLGIGPDWMFLVALAAVGTVAPMLARYRIGSEAT